MNNISCDQVEKAVHALKTHVYAKEEKDILQTNNDIPILLTLTTKQIPTAVKKTPIHMPLKHSLYDSFENPKICLITADPRKHWKQVIKEQNIDFISKVIDIEKLKTTFSPFEQRRILCNSYDQFIADTCIIDMLPQYLGKEFFKKKKLPYPVNMKSTNLKQELHNGINTVYFMMNYGTCNTVKIAKMGQSNLHIVENIMDTIPRMIDIIPNGWDNIRSIHIKCPHTFSLPVYNTLD